MNRRNFLLGALALAAGAKPALAHTPYGQWVVYRKKHLLVGAHRADPRTYDLAKELAALLLEHLPESRSRVARAPTAERIASLIGTEQLDIAVLARADAAGMLRGSGRFRPYGAIALQLLAELGPHQLVAHERFPMRHAWLVAGAVHPSFIGNAQIADAGLDWHPGALAFIRGEPEPDGE
jgi:hypothetical protein